MKVWFAICTLIGFLVIVGTGCGGGGGGTSTTSTTGGPVIVRYAVEALKSGTMIDPTNIVQGETVQFRVSGYTAANVRVNLSSSGWAADPTGQSEGTMSGSGQYFATATGPQFTVSATADGSSQSGPAQVKAPGQALVSGRVVDGLNHFVWSSVVDFYNAGGVLVGSSIVQGNGAFRAVVPTTAVTFEVRKTSIPAGYYKQFQYQTKWYLPQGACRAPLPSLSAGGSVGLGDILVPPTSNNGSSLPPPPPPSPCV